MFKPHPSPVIGTQAGAVNQAALKNAQEIGQNSVSQGSAAISTQKVSEAMLDEFEGIIGRLMSVSDRTETVLDRLFGERPSDKEDNGKPMPPGAVGMFACKLQHIRIIIDQLENNTFRLEQLA